MFLCLKIVFIEELSFIVNNKLYKYIFYNCDFILYHNYIYHLSNSKNFNRTNIIKHIDNSLNQKIFISKDI
jgi:hypothetical protein